MVKAIACIQTADLAASSVDHMAENTD